MPSFLVPPPALVSPSVSQAEAYRLLTEAAPSVAASSPADSPTVGSRSSRQPLALLRWLSRVSVLPSDSPSRTPPPLLCSCPPGFPCRVPPPWLRPFLRMISGLHPYLHPQRPAHAGFSAARPRRVALRTRLSAVRAFRSTTLLCPLLTSGRRSETLTTLSVPFWDTCQTSWGKFDRLQRTTAGFTTRALDGYGLVGHKPARPARHASYPVSVRRLTPLFRASFGHALTG